MKNRSFPVPEVFGETDIARRNTSIIKASVSRSSAWSRRHQTCAEDNIPHPSNNGGSQFPISAAAPPASGNAEPSFVRERVLQ
ncbi:hypothetical protein G3A56_14145 [Rhizobium oryzihabitans]|uniref:Uncharacterized protein n=1 Tax=Rhizobium oryzihabitans TaxID=2267833 RepID=A0A7L5BJL6_9HYPH|nr:hypothetical protein G3A56_14145 [Rhizobium oryzihabitans]CUX28980.1 hypothetical protein AGR5A_Cc30042 [Agrobacterium genomosp. 5 str. CFBP 6626]